ncbi:hypothetical protein BACCAP_02934 [Pseudoflavonifractor capillosus ATCC 29799]|uniref:Uncharacterized protein n=1 Tax=Pseudoflavonifractor capillosus ATCC 29799 TaxID=411467 RepID=A6NXI7_9FIRM|nr:hypothetical protein BACCAP_02934 [Pseudoflavonifractor capillosus ATCC 29799]
MSLRRSATLLGLSCTAWEVHCVCQSPVCIKYLKAEEVTITGIFLKHQYSKEIDFPAISPPFFDRSLSQFCVVNKCRTFQTDWNNTHILSSIILS